MEKSEFEHLGHQIFDAALEVHKYLGPGLLESIYEHSLVTELGLRHIPVVYQIQTPLFYKGHNTGKHYLIDMLVANEIVIEVKSVDTLLPVHHAQLLTYMKLSNKSLGFLVNFKRDTSKKRIQKEGE